MVPGGARVPPRLRPTVYPQAAAPGEGVPSFPSCHCCLKRGVHMGAVVVCVPALRDECTRLRLFS